jgi:hypothetical protein
LKLGGSKLAAMLKTASSPPSDSTLLSIMEDELPGPKSLAFSTDCYMGMIVGLPGFGFNLSSPKKGHEPWSVIGQNSAALAISHLIHDWFDNNRMIIYSIFTYL